MCLSVPSMANGGFIRPLRTTLRCHRGRTSCSRGLSIVILRMTLWSVLSWMAVGGFSNFRTLELEALCTRIVFTFLFWEKGYTKYSARVINERSFVRMPLLLAQRAKAFHCELYTLLDESRRGSAAISTTVSGKWWRFKTSRISSTRLDPIVWDRGGIEGAVCWAHTGTVGCLREGSEDVCSTGAEEGATVGMDVGMRSWWPWCPGTFGFSGESWEQWEPEEMHTLVPSCPMIGTGRLPPMLCRPGKEKQRRASPCSPLWQTCPSGEFRRHRTVCSRFRLEGAILLDWVDWDGTEHRLWRSWLLGGVWVWELSQTDPGVRTVPEFFEIGTGNVFPLVCGCMLLPYCCRSRLWQSDVSTEDPIEVEQVGPPPVPTSWYDVGSLELTMVRKSDGLSNWLPSLWEMHPWRRTDWGPEDVTEPLSSLLDLETNAGKRGSPHPTGLEYPTTADVESTVVWTRTGETEDEDGRWI